MSRPATPYSGTMPMLSPSEMEKFEAPLIALANLSGGDLRKLFYAFFSFLNRRTDFYCVLPKESSESGRAHAVGRNMGFREGQAEQILLASFRQFPLRRVGTSKPKAGASAAAGSSAASPSNSLVATANSVGGTSVASMPSSQGAANAANAGGLQPNAEKDTASAEKAGAAPTRKSSSDRDSAEKTTKHHDIHAIRYTEDGKQIPIGNGGSTSRYVWTQTLEEVTVLLPVPEGTRAKDLDVKIGPTSLTIRNKNKSSSDSTDTALAPLEGTLYAKIRPSESTWTLESSGSNSERMVTLQIILDKYQKTWWDTVLSGDPIIDNSLVDSTRRIETYDEQTQAQIRRIMFDQRQERLGLPSSGELTGESVRVPPLPNGVEYIDGETLDKATIS